MNFLAPFKTLRFENARERSVQHSRPKTRRHAVAALGALCFALTAQDLPAQVGDNNPGGHSGIFNGQINTGCSYDPYTGNATRSITDIAVAGAVGKYPLALVRSANSRAPSTTEVFGFAGGWNHNYNWILEESEHSQPQNFHPASYTVEFPDGRVETFKQVNWDTSCYRVRASNGGMGSSAGVRERFVQLDLNPNNQTYLYAYLVLPDGGKIEFKAVRYTNGNGRWWYKYHATAIYDPYGLKTQLVSSTTPSGLWRRLDWVIEPAGRSLHFVYTGPNSPRIASVTASDGRVVNYNYVYCNGCRLDNVVYYNNANWTARYQYTGSNVGLDLPLLLWAADDPMYPGPMKRIAYQYKPGGLNDPNNPDGTRPVYGQILRERYWDGVSQPGTGVIVSELTVGASPSNHNVRTEKRADNANQTRTFTYTGNGYLTWVTDFMGHSANQGYDSYNWINSVTNFRRIATDYTCDPITGNVTQIKFPLTPDDTQGQGQTHPTVNYTYTNNYYLHTIQGENGQISTITRDPNNNRITRVDYPDGGYETLAYDAAHFYQMSSHRMTTGGTETFAYDTRNRLQYYADPYHSNPGNPSIQYFYDGLDRVNGVLDALSHPTNWDYNDRGQVTTTTLPADPINGQRHTIVNTYNPNGNGTLVSVRNELLQTTTYEYDDYRRLKSVTPPVRGAGDTGTYTTRFYYGANPWDGINDYKIADSNMTYVVPPSTSFRKIQSVYDDNRRKSSLTVAPGTAAEATTAYTYDNGGNVTWITGPGDHWTSAAYDERNRPSSVSDRGRVTSLTYDTAGHRKTVTRPNGQVITYDTFDAMNRVTQQTVTQTPDPNAVTTFSYYTTADGANAPVGLLKTMKDPRLVALNSAEVYKYEYDLMGRKTKITYPRPQANGLLTYEQQSYDAVGRLEMFTNRDGKVQTFGYDALNRMTGFTWNDGGLTPSVTFGYDAASRLIEIDNANASISCTYYNDNLLHTETQSLSASGGLDNRQVIYTYDGDGNRSSLTMPGYTFDYVYTHRSQVKQINDHSAGLSQAYYEYNTSGNVTLRNVYTTPITVSNYSYDPSDRVTSVTHTLNGTTRTYTYGYYDNSYNRKYAKRGISPNSPEGNKGEVFDYDLADQAIVAKLNIVNPDTASPGNQTIFHDANGNRTTFSAYGVTDTYTINNLNQYTKRNNKNASYGPSGTMSGSPDSGASQLTCTYDAQNRLRTAGKDSTSMSFKYDGLNRQVSRTGNGVTTYSTWDGWNLVEEYTNNPLAIQARYLYGPTGLVKDLQNNRYYCQDGSGSTSHLLDSTGHVLEWYRYDLQGAPFFYNPNDTQRSPNQSGFNVRHLFTGQQWHQDIGLYDLRNRFYSPDLGRFLQPDPIGFAGDATNLYRYCGNNPVTKWDQFGLLDFRIDPSPSRSDSGDPWMKIEGMTPDDYFENTRNLPDSDSSEGPGVEVGVGPIPDSGGNPGPGGPPGGTGGPGGSGGLGGLGGVGGLAAGDGGPGGRTLGNSPAKIFLGKFLQSFNSQGDWKQTADALDAFAAFAVNLLFFGEGGVAWGVGRPVLSASTRVTFARGTIQSTVLRRPMTVFRYWGGESRIYGNYLATADTVSQISSPNAASIALALPEGNTAATLSRFTIPAGARVWTGGIAGGADTATQVYVLNPDVLIVGGL